MKSSWELAMERLDAEDPDAGKALTEEQKNKLAEIDSKYDAKIAERKIFLKKALAEATEQGNAEEAEQVHLQIADETLRLEDERERAKSNYRDQI